MVDSVVVSPAALRSRGGEVAGLAERLAGVRRRWAPVADEPGGALGYRESTQRYAELADAWFGELGGYVRVLEELAAGLTEAAAGYRAADDEAARRIAAAGP
ncbi:type VII secretion target [Rhizomonospora bruguierae]|uniref:type VII secretion target n=1 Tax=Rhizomonospora bruguierae TaxID=1581705 RepID=UPI001BCE3B8B|nr:type VII secretion target [Micromonospora sp. NBRC 107566]